VPQPTDPKPRRRAYNSPLRREKAAETREQIVSAGADLLHGFPIWNWAALTVRAVADRAGVSPRTVYRHFAGERQLRDAVLERLRDEAGIDLQGLRLEDVKGTARGIFEYVSSFPIQPRTLPDPSVAAENVRQRTALLAAVQPAARHWSPVDRKIAAGMLDVLWSPVSYERLVADWGLPPKEAVRALVWVISLLEAAVRDGPRP
jgi:AcrR family transcriptional regulator